MSSSRAQARKHLNKAEFDLYASLHGKQAEQLTPYRLKLKLVRIEKLKEKYSAKKRIQRRGQKQQGLDATALSNLKIKLSLVDEMLKLCKLAIKAKRN